jgi:hypothetical protein
MKPRKRAPRDLAAERHLTEIRLRLCDCEAEPETAAKLRAQLAALDAEVEQ